MLPFRASLKSFANSPKIPLNITQSGLQTREREPMNVWEFIITLCIFSWQTDQNDRFLGYFMDGFNLTHLQTSNNSCIKSPFLVGVKVEQGREGAIEKFGPRQEYERGGLLMDGEE